MSEASKVFMPVAVGPANDGPAVSKIVLYVAFTNTPVTPVRKRIHLNVRYVGPMNV